MAAPGSITQQTVGRRSQASSRCIPSPVWIRLQARIGNDRLSGLFLVPGSGCVMPEKTSVLTLLDVRWVRRSTSHHFVLKLLGSLDHFLVVLGVQVEPLVLGRCHEPLEEAGITV